MKKNLNFCLSMALLLEAGLAPAEALNALAQERKSLEVACRALEGGLGLAQSLALEGSFDADLLALVRCGEGQGTLAPSFRAASQMLALKEQLKNAALTAALYPLLLLLFAGGALAFLSSVALPQYQAFFEASGAALRGGSRALFAFGRFWAKWWFLVLPLVMALLVGLARWGGFRWLASLPLARGFFHSTAQAQELALLHAALESGATLDSALEWVARTCSRRRAEGYRTLAHALALGAPLTEGVAKKLWSPSVRALLAAGVAGNRLKETLALSAGFAREECQKALKRALTLVEPLLLLAMGVLVGLLAWGLYSPLLTAVEALI